MSMQKVSLSASAAGADEPESLAGSSLQVLSRKLLTCCGGFGQFGDGFSFSRTLHSRGDYLIQYLYFP